MIGSACLALLSYSQTWRFDRYEMWYGVRQCNAEHIVNISYPQPFGVKMFVNMSGVLFASRRTQISPANCYYSDLVSLKMRQKKSRAGVRRECEGLSRPRKSETVFA